MKVLATRQGEKLCYAGQAHGLDGRTFRLASAVIHCLHYGVHIGACQLHLDKYLDYADDHTNWEPDKIEWL